MKAIYSPVDRPKVSTARLGTHTSKSMNKYKIAHKTQFSATFWGIRNAHFSFSPRAIKRGQQQQFGGWGDNVATATRLEKLRPRRQDKVKRNGKKNNFCWTVVVVVVVVVELDACLLANKTVGDEGVEDVPGTLGSLKCEALSQSCGKRTRMWVRKGGHEGKCEAARALTCAPESHLEWQPNKSYLIWLWRFSRGCCQQVYTHTHIQPHTYIQTLAHLANSFSRSQLLLQEFQVHLNSPMEWQHIARLFAKVLNVMRAWLKASERNELPGWLVGWLAGWLTRCGCCQLALHSWAFWIDVNFSSHLHLLHAIFIIYARAWWDGVVAWVGAWGWGWWRATGPNSMANKTDKTHFRLDDPPETRVHPISVWH